MTEMNQPPFFAQFFRDIKQQLGIDPDVDKYVQFLMLTQRYISTDAATEFNWEKIYRTAEAMFLSRNHINDRQTFRNLFLEALREESGNVRNRLDTLLAAKHIKEEDKPETVSKKEAKLSNDETMTETRTEKKSIKKAVETAQKEEKQVENTKVSKKYINIDVSAPSTEGGQMPNDTSNQTAPTTVFRMTDDYLPIFRRDMAQLWRVLRFQEKHGFSDELDIPNTVQRIAKDGWFLNPVFEIGRRNREESLLIFVDYRGSMTAFHRFSQGVIEAALGDGGHSKASVFYFQNCPLNHVFLRGSDFRKTVHLDTILNRANPHQTVVLIISDAGAARGNWNENRIYKTAEFIDRLNQRIARIAWLNPMPHHRWFGSTAETIACGVAMFPVLDANHNGMSQAIQYLSGRNIQGYPVD